MELPSDMIFGIFTYISCDYKSLCAVSHELRSALRTRAYFAACGPVQIETIPRSAHVLVRSFTERRRLLLKCGLLSREYIYAHADGFSSDEWDALDTYMNLPEDFLDKYFDKLHMHARVRQPLSESFLRKHMEKLAKYNIFRFHRVSESFVCDYNAAHGLNDNEWEHVALRCPSDELIAEFDSALGWLHNPHSGMWYHISKYTNLPDLFMHRYAHCLCWARVSKHQILSEAFIAAHSEEVNWESISKHQDLSEEFIYTYRDRVDWNNIMRHQGVSQIFILTHARRQDRD